MSRYSFFTSETMTARSYEPLTGMARPKGGGKKTGQCCAGIELHAEPDGRLVVAQSD